MLYTIMTPERESMETLSSTSAASDAATPQACRFCGTSLRHTFVDLGTSPLCETFLTESELGEMEPFYPLTAYVCADCFLVQVPAHVSGEHIFSHYAYFSSYSDSWLQHASRHVDMITEKLSLTTKSSVVETASNDGYLLQNFVAMAYPCWVSNRPPTWQSWRWRRAFRAS